MRCGFIIKIYYIIFLSIIIKNVFAQEQIDGNNLLNKSNKTLNVAYFTTCDIQHEQNFADLSCISIFTPGSYFIVRKTCFIKLLKDNKSMYIFYNNTFLTINYMIETPNNFYVKSNYYYNNFELSKYISFTNTTKLHNSTYEIFAIMFVGNVLVNITNINSDNSVLNQFNDAFFRHDIFNGKINYFSLPIFPLNISETVIYPNYTSLTGCDHYTFNINSYHFFNDHCDIELGVYN